MYNGPNSSRKQSLSAEVDTVALLWDQFESLYPMEDDCLQELYRRADQESFFSCRHCGSPDLMKSYGARIAKCRHCKRNTWLTAGSFFNRMRHAKPWLAAIWFFEHGVVISSSRLHKLAGIAQSSALKILSKIRTVLQFHMREDSPKVPSSFFTPIFTKRSRETPARAHPIVEQEVFENKTVESSSDLNSSPEQMLINEEAEAIGMLSEQERIVYSLLSQTPLDFDSMYQHLVMPVGELSASLTMLELAGLATRLFGDRYVRNIPIERTKIDGFSISNEDLPSEMKDTISTFMNVVRSCWHGISRKYLQNYLAEYWCHVARTRWTNGALLQECLQFGQVSYREILDYVTPVRVKVLTC